MTKRRSDKSPVPSEAAKAIPDEQESDALIDSLFGGEPDAGFGGEPDAGFGGEPDAGFGGEPDAGDDIADGPQDQNELTTPREAPLSSEGQEASSGQDEASQEQSVSPPDEPTEEEFLDDLSDIELLDGEPGETAGVGALDFHDAVRPSTQIPMTESERVAALVAGEETPAITSPPQMPDMPLLDSFAEDTSEDHSISGEGEELGAPTVVEELREDIADTALTPPSTELPGDEILGDEGVTVLAPPPAHMAAEQESLLSGLTAAVDEEEFIETAIPTGSVAPLADNPTADKEFESELPPSEEEDDVVLQTEPGTDAVVSLIQRGEREAWCDRADWLYEESRAIEDPKKRARALTVISELLAMAGESERAVEVVRQALELSPDDPVAHRQRRGLAVNSNSWADVTEFLEEEAGVAASSHAKTHAYGLAGHLRRLNAPGDASYRTSLDLAERALPTDVRPIMQRVAVELALSDEAPAPIEGVPALLKSAVDVLRVMRSEGRDGQGGEDNHPYVMLLEARDALRRRDVAGALACLEKLDQHETLSGGSRWLRAALAAPHRELRPMAVSALHGVSEGSHGVLATRSLVARALEAGDEQTVATFANSAGAEVLSSADRLALAGLTAKSFDSLTFERLDSWIADSARDEDYETLSSAVSGLICGEHAPGATQQVGTARHRSESRLGRLLASISLGALEMEEAADSCSALLQEDATHGAARAVQLEQAHRARRLRTVAEAFAERDRDGRLLSLLLHELDHAAASSEVLSSASESPAEEDEELAAAGDLEKETAQPFAECAELEQASKRSPQSEVLLRMALRHSSALSTAPGAAAAVAVQAEALEEPKASAAAWREAALRYVMAGMPSEAVDAFSRSVSEDESWSLAHDLAHHLARNSKDDDVLLQWLKRRAAFDHVEPAIERLRQALRPASVSEEGRDALLDEALALRPSDASLRELHATLTGRRAACAPDDVTVVELAIEGALGSELDRDWSAMKAYTDRAEALGDTLFVPMLRQRLASVGVDAEAHAEQLCAEARATSDVERRAELSLAAARDLMAAGESERAQAFLQEELTRGGGALTLAHQFTSTFLSTSNDEDLVNASKAIASAVGGFEAVAHLKLAARLEGRQNMDFDFVPVAREILQHASGDPWSLRVLQADAMKRQDADAMMPIAETLVAQQEGDLDRATLWLRVAELYLADGREESAQALLDRVLEIWPRHLLGRLLRAKVLERHGTIEMAAEAHERLGKVCRTPAKRVEAFYRAASIWLSRDDDEAKQNSRRLLELVNEIDAGYKDSFELLRAIYMASGAKSELADLLGARLSYVEDADHRTELEVMRGKILAETGSATEAKAALAAALAASPDNVEALRAFVEVCTTERDWSSAEQALLRLGRLLTEPEERSAIYMQLGQLYDGPLSKPDRAEKAYQEVIRASPEELRPREKLVALYLRDGATDKALEQQRAMVEVATDSHEQCVRTIRVATLLEQMEDFEQAEAVLVGARRRFNKDAEPVRGLVDFYRRHEKYAAADMLLGRAAAEVRRGLGAGRFEPNLFAMTATVAELRGHQETAEIAAASYAAIGGERISLSGKSSASLDANNDDLLAPAVFGDSFRQLLMHSGGIMDAAVPLDLPGLGASRLDSSQEEISERVRHLAGLANLGEVTLLVSGALERRCLAVSGVDVAGTPPMIVMGETLLRGERGEILDFLLRRAVKNLQTRTTALARTAPSDLGSLLAAFLKLYKTDFVPTGVDPGKFKAFTDRMVAAGGVAPNPAMASLAADVIASIGNRASGLNMAAQVWASRASLLATGDLHVAIEAVAWASGADVDLPPSGADRIKWIGRHAEARDLAVYTLSEAYQSVRLR